MDQVHFAAFGWKVLSSYCQKNSLLQRFSALSFWSMRIISLLLIPWCLLSSKWEWNDACLMVFPLMNLLNLDWKLSVLLPMYYFKHALHEKWYAKLVEEQFKLSGLMQYSLLGIERSKCFSSHNLFHIMLPPPPPLLFLLGEEEGL